MGTLYCIMPMQASSPAYSQNSRVKDVKFWIQTDAQASKRKIRRSFKKLVIGRVLFPLSPGVNF